MYFIELKREVCSRFKENDPYRISKQLQVGNWCYAFSALFSSSGPNRLSFFLDALSDEECWEKTDSIHLVKFNRRLVAKKIIQLQSWRGRTNPLDDFDRFQIACWCCLEEEIVNLFECFKRQFEIRSADAVAVKRLVNLLSRGTWSDPMTEYWSQIMGGCFSDLELENKHLYEYGLNLALQMEHKHVEAVEFFWNKISSLPEYELDAQQKSEILLRTALRSGTHCWVYPEIFEFCVNHISPDKYIELLERDFEENNFHSCLGTLHDIRRFDLIKKLFDCFQPNDISEDTYCAWLTSLEIEEYSGYYESEAVELFMHIWSKDGFQKHRVFALKEICNSVERRNLLVSFVKKNYMKPLWAVLDESSSYHIKAFMNSEHAHYICSMLRKREDLSSLNKFLSYNSFVLKDLENTDRIEVNLCTAPELEF